MERVMFKEQLLVDVPDSFQQMKQDRMELMYPYEERPQIILEDSEACRFCTFSLLETQELSKEQVKHAVREIMKVVRSLYPSCILEEMKVADCREGKCGWFSFQMAGTEGEMLHLMYIYPVSGCMMLGTMGCRIEDKVGNQQMMEMLKSLKDLKKKSYFRKLGRGGRIL